MTARPASRPRAKGQPARIPRWLPALDDPRAGAILASAFEVFMERGFEGATMLEIATRARVSKLTLYAVFADKDGLFEALVAWGAERYALDYAAIEAQAETDPASALLAYALAATRTLLRWQSMALLRIAVSQQPRAPAIARRLYDLTHGRHGPLVMALAQRLVKAGLIEDDVPGFVSDFHALIRGEFFFEGLLGASPAPARAAVESHVRRALGRLMRAYAPPASAPS
ncbi:MAG: TetR/AcrR family transcriptional regulator [Hyphomonadaceae bacterium]